MSDLDLDALEALEKAATPGPWKPRQPIIDHPFTCLEAEPFKYLAEELNWSDAAFIASLRNVASVLTAKAREFDALKARLETSLDQTRFVFGPEKFDEFERALDNPPEPNEALKRLMRKGKMAATEAEHDAVLARLAEAQLAEQRATQEAHELRSALETAQAALEPFARPLLNDQYLHDIQVILCETRNEATQLELRVSDFRRARAALDVIKARTTS